MKHMILEDVSVFLLMIIGVVSSYFLLSILWGAPYSPSSRSGVREVLSYVLKTYYSDKREVKVVDLGSGFGRVCFEAVKLDSRVICHGIEIDPIKVLWSRVAAKIKGVDGRVVFRRGDVRKADLNGYDIIYMFLWKPITTELEYKILREVRNPCVVISLEHPLRTAIEKRGRFYIMVVNRGGGG